MRTDNRWTLSLTLNGCIVGVVAQCGGCDNYHIWSALLIGMFAALTYMGISKLMLSLKLDDPLDAVAVHAGGGKHYVNQITYFEVCILLKLLQLSWPIVKNHNNSVIQDY